MLYPMLLALCLQDPDALVKQLGNEDPEAREQASEAIEKMGTRALPALRGAVASRDPEVSVRAQALILGIKLADLRAQLKERHEQRKASGGYVEFFIHLGADPDVPFRFVLAAVEAAVETEWWPPEFEPVPEADVPSAGSPNEDRAEPAASALASEDTTPEPNEVVLEATRHGRFKVDDREMTLEELREFMAGRRKMAKFWFDPAGRSVNYPVTVRADQGAPWGRVARALQSIKEDGGVYRIRLSAALDGSKAEGVVPTHQLKQSAGEACERKKNDTEFPRVRVKMNGEEPVWVLEELGLCSYCKVVH